MNWNDNQHAFMAMIRADAVPALGCTEPIAVAFTAANAANYIQQSPVNINVVASPNLWKNGKSVSVPGTGRKGLAVAAAAGALYGDASLGLLVLSKMTPEEAEAAVSFAESGAVTVGYEPGHADVYVRCSIDDGKTRVVAVTEGAHNRLQSVVVDGELLFETPPVSSGASACDITLAEIFEMAETVDLDALDFVRDGIRCNLRAAEEGLAGAYGLQTGRTLRSIAGQGPWDVAMETRILTAAAADLRMGGGNLPIITSGGSGNQGLGVLIPVYCAWKEKGLSEEMLHRAIFLSHAINKYVKLFSGKLSGMCGCSIAAGVGSAAAIAWMCGGGQRAAEGAVSNMLANLTGMICDGAKDSCALKLSTCAAESVLAAKMALAGMIVEPRVGVVGSDLDQTIRNIGRLSRNAFPRVDAEVLEMIGENCSAPPTSEACAKSAGR